LLLLGSFEVGEADGLEFVVFVSLSRRSSGVGGSRVDEKSIKNQ
jgi:hypothetical protein